MVVTNVAPAKAVFSEFGVVPGFDTVIDIGPDGANGFMATVVGDPIVPGPNYYDAETKEFVATVLRCGEIDYLSRAKQKQLFKLNTKGLNDDYWYVLENNKIDYIYNSDAGFNISEYHKKNNYDNFVDFFNSFAQAIYYDLIKWNAPLNIEGSHEGDDYVNIQLAKKDGNLVHGWEGSDTIIGSDKDDVLVEGASESDHNIIHGKKGVDELIYSFSWDDRKNETGVVINGGVNGGQPGDVVKGIEILEATEHDDDIKLKKADSSARKKFDILVDTFQGDDSIQGSKSNEDIDAGPGDDFMTGGQGQDRMKGGPGSDTFYFQKSDNEDVIQKFNRKEDTVWIDVALAKNKKQLKKALVETKAGVELDFGKDELSIHGVHNMKQLSKVVEFVDLDL